MLSPSFRISPIVILSSAEQNKDKQERRKKTTNQTETLKLAAIQAFANVIPNSRMGNLNEEDEEIVVKQKRIKGGIENKKKEEASDDRGIGWPSRNNITAEKD